MKQGHHEYTRLIGQIPTPYRAILSHWLSQVPETARPLNRDDLHWFVLGNRFIEWQVGTFDGDTAKLAHNVHGGWKWLCLDVGEQLYRTRYLRHGLASEAVYRWREAFGLPLLRALRDQGAELTDQLVSLALTPSWIDLKTQDFCLLRLTQWKRKTRTLHVVDQPGYWWDRLLREDTAEQVQRQTIARRQATEGQLYRWWRGFVRRRPVVIVDPDRPIQFQIGPGPIERATAILSGTYDPGPLPPRVPRGQYPRKKPRRRRAP